MEHLFCSSFFVSLLSQNKNVMKKEQIRINFFDYLYYTIGTGVRGIEILLIPLLWVFLLIVMNMRRPLHIGWCIFFAVLAGLVDYGISYIYDKRGPAVRQYFDNTKYSKEGWKWLTFTLWLVLCGVLPSLIIVMFK